MEAPMKLAIVLAVALSQVIYTRAVDANYNCASKESFMTCLGVETAQELSAAEKHITKAVTHLKPLTSRNLVAYVTDLETKCTSGFKPNLASLKKYLQCTDDFVEKCPTESKDLPKKTKEIKNFIQFQCDKMDDIVQATDCITANIAEIRKCQVPKASTSCFQITTALSCLKALTDEKCPNMAQINLFQKKRNVELFEALKSVECAACRGYSISILTVVSLALIALFNI
ncbi:uncharacterized protein LOC141901941 [Tubulanus polymorphus]|uniref:uncharacterized protein LOC141901941 n=1 Tax=Tubulanus polymorphus TaxID=672921 RepID=UPI003DA51266